MEAAAAALRYSQSAVLVALVLVQAGGALGLALLRGRTTLGHLLGAIGASLIGLAVVLGLAPLRALLGIEWPGPGPWAVGLAAALIVVLAAAGTRLALQPEA